MRTLVIETATEACSAALFEDGELVAGAYEVLGRGHAERLVPMIAELPGKGRAGRIAVSLGPGSFTGVRIGVAAARALGLAWQAEVLGYPTLALVAAMAQTLVAATIPAARGAEHVTVCMTGGHGEWFVQDFEPGVVPDSEVESLTPKRARDRVPYAFIAGSKALEYVGDDSFFVPFDLLPDARQFTLLPEVLLSTDLAPIYGRPPDARLPA